MSNDIQANDNYVTPYIATIVFNADSIFESMVAALAARAQLLYGSDRAAVHSCKLSPELIIFGPRYDVAEIQALFERGFKVIRIFLYDDSQQYSDCGAITFGLAELYDNISLISGVFPVYILEHIICSQFPKYVSKVSPSITYINGQHLITAAEFDGINIYALAVELSQSYYGFDKLDALIQKGAMIHSIRESHTNLLLAGAPIISIKHDNCKCAVIAGTSYMREIVTLAPIHPRITRDAVKYILLYELTAANKINIIVVGLSDDHAKDILTAANHDPSDGNMVRATIPFYEFARIIGAPECSDEEDPASYDGF